MNNHDMNSQSSDAFQEQPHLWKWILSVIFLSISCLTTGTVNLYPSQRDSILKALNISESVGTFMLTGGVMLMYITLPTGIFMDHFGGNITLVISSIIIIISYTILSIFNKNTWIFIIFYLLMSFGSSSLLIVCLHLTFSRSPKKIKGISASVITAALSMSFGMFLEIYKAGRNVFKCNDNDCVFSSFRLVAIVTIVMIIISCPSAYIFYRQFPHVGNKPSTKSWSLFLDYKLYSFLVGMFVTVFDGMIVLEAGQHIWKLYGHSYPSGASDWGMLFSVINCIMTLLVSAILDWLKAKYSITRIRSFGTFYSTCSIILLILGIIYIKTDNEILFAIFFSMLGIPFGVGLTQIQTLVSDTFGNDKYGFAFGIAQFGSVIASASAMPLFLKLQKNGIMITFFVFSGLHLILGLVFIFSRNDDEQNENTITNPILIDETE